MICIAQGSNDHPLEWSALDRSFVVESELKLHLVNGRLSYEVVAVPQYEKTYTHEREVDVGTETFVAYLEKKLLRSLSAAAHVERRAA